MKSVLALEVSEGTIECVAADLAVVPVLEIERPLRGDAGRVDWRLCGLLSRLVGGGAFTGEPGQAALLPSRGAMRAPRVLAIGLGPGRGSAVAALEVFSRTAVSRALALGVHSLVLSPVLSGRRPRISVREGSLAVMGGALASLGERPAALRLRLLVREGGIREAAGALAEASRRVREVTVAVEIQTPEPRVVRGLLPRSGDPPTSSPPTGPRVSGPG